MTLAATSCAQSETAPSISTSGCWPASPVLAGDSLGEDVIGVWVGTQNAAPVYWEFREDGSVVTNRLSDVDDTVSRSTGIYRVVEDSIEFLDDEGQVLVAYQMELDSNGAWVQPSWDMRKCRS